MMLPCSLTHGPHVCNNNIKLVSGRLCLCDMRGSLEKHCAKLFCTFQRLCIMGYILIRHWTQNAHFLYAEQHHYGRDDGSDCYFNNLFDVCHQLSYTSLWLINLAVMGVFHN